MKKIIAFCSMASAFSLSLVFRQPAAQSIYNPHMPYDAGKDVEIDKKEVEVNGQRFLVSLKAYDGGEPKVAISLANGRFPVKRLTPDQLVAIADAVRDWVGRKAGQ